MTRKAAKSVLFSEDGEVLSVKDLTRERQVEKEKYYTNLDDNRKFFNVKLEAVKMLETVSNKKLGYAVLLATYLRYDSNVLFLKEKTNHPLQIDDFHIAIEKTARTGRAVFKELQETGILQTTQYISEQNKVFEDVVTLNSDLFYRGSFMRGAGIKTAKAFIEVIRQLYAENDAAILGALFKLVPHIDKHTNFICINADRNPLTEDVKGMRMQQIADLVGISRQKARVLLLKSRYDGYSVIVQTRNASGLLYKLNPATFSKMSGSVKDTVLQDFKGYSAIA